MVFGASSAAKRTDRNVPSTPNGFDESGQVVGATPDHPTELIRGLVERLLRASDRASDPTHPVGSIAVAIRRALPDFHDWNFKGGEAAVRFVTVTGHNRDGLRAVLPPGFAEGQPGAFVRATRAVVRHCDFCRFRFAVLLGRGLALWNLAVRRGSDGGIDVTALTQDRPHPELGVRAAQSDSVLPFLGGRPNTASAARRHILHAFAWSLE